MICSYILTALVGFLIGGICCYSSYKDKIREYKKKLLFTLDYCKKQNNNTDNILILDLED